MACELRMSPSSSAPASRSKAQMESQGLPVSQAGLYDDNDFLARLATHLQLDSSNNMAAGPGSMYRGRQSVEDLDFDYAQLPQRHYVSTAATCAQQATVMPPTEDAQSIEAQDAANDEDGEARDSEGEEKPSRTRDKNRRAQQRFRQRQKAKLQAKEQETVQLQKQVQDLQAQLVSMRISGTLPVYRQQLEQSQSRCQALQSENNEIRALAMLYMDENARLHADRKQQLLPPSRDLFCASGLDDGFSLPKQIQHLTSASLSPGQKPESIWLDILRQSKSMEPNLPRFPVFKNLHQVPWQVAPHRPEEGLPAGCASGRTQMCVLFKLLSRTCQGSATVLVKFPPGFMHDYVICSENQIEEGIILEGSMTDTVLKQTFFPGDYCRILPGHQHGPYRADCTEGALCFVITRKSKE